ncbi:hypothetical protein [Mycolicibacterium conceptionense]|uniref:hypothetical protein n=1 Tax=Mycolicibacterium conceptionense TaxID=451644 RepID=UPI0007EB653B|nr:hypothetical protein [Mycolicibacterium conceptionense]
MRIRSTKPKFWESKTIAQLDWETRLVLKGLESYVDDNGVGKDDIELIATSVFPRDTFRNPRETLARLSEAISRIAAAVLIVRYEVNGEKLLYIDDWKNLQRIDKPAKGRYPRPDGTFEYSQDVNRESYGSPPEHCAPGVGEQGNRGTGESTDLPDPDGSSVIDLPVQASDFPATFDPIPPSNYPEPFERWWHHYPRKAGKRKAFAAWQSARRRATDEQLIEGAKRYAADPNRTDQFTKYPEGWLSRDGWDDDPLPARNGNNGHRVAASDAAFAAAQALKTPEPSGRLELE